METGKLVTALMGGFSDTVMLPHLALLAAWGVLLLILSEDRPLPIRALLGFILGYLPLAVFLRAGVFSAFLSTEAYYGCVRFFYAGLGLLLIAAGGIFAYRWFQCYRLEVPQGLFWKVRSSGLAALYLTSLLGFMAGGMAAIAGSCWPANVAVMALSAEMFLPGLLRTAVWAIVIYEAVFPVLLVALFFAFRYFSVQGGRVFLNRKRSLVLAVLAGVYMSLGLGLMAIFIKQLF